MTRLAPTKPLSELVPKGREGGSEFARIVDMLLFYEARHSEKTINLFSDRSGDWNGLDSFGNSDTRIKDKTGCQYKFFPSPLTTKHRAEIEASLKKAASKHKKRVRLQNGLSSRQIIRQNPADGPTAVM